MEDSKHKGLAVPQVLRGCLTVLPALYVYFERFVSLWGGLLCHGRDLLSTQGHVVDADIVNQAGEGSACIEGFAGADV